MNFIKAALPAVLALALASCSAEAAQRGQADSANAEWTFDGKEQQKLLIDVIGSAKSTLDIAIYSLTEPGIVAAIRDAEKRGVSVRIITDRQQAGGKTQTEALKLLGSAGIPIKINKHSGLMHLKMTIADSKVGTTGSFNYSKSAMNENDEILMAVRDERAARSFAQQFESMWNDAKRFEPADYRIAQPDPSGQPDGASEQMDGAPFASCAAARAAGKAPLRKGEPGYNAKLDGDGDGVACESR
ncbi:phospholipase D-like domain-containing protein [Cohnella caldifontis]|uniref:phospholipase D-like domain-containing protein n=1 Tax=Cohnella caldifontis TaxID=3027471 RepID=UPI0023ED5247|nr:phospholipase D-like domain-containing protein [Cohnella sp. YIM B05605]